MEVDEGQGAGVWRRGLKQRDCLVVGVVFVDFGGDGVGVEWEEREGGVDVDVDVVVEVERGGGMDVTVGLVEVDVEVATTVDFGFPKIVEGKLNT